MTIVKTLTGWLRGARAWPSAERTGRPVAAVAGVPLADDSPLVRQTAERLRQRAQAAGGWAAEAGGLPVEAYLPEARRLVQRVVLGVSEGGPPAP
jgi:hypothetical protein